MKKSIYNFIKKLFILTISFIMLSINVYASEVFVNGDGKYEKNVETQCGSSTTGADRYKKCGSFSSLFSVRVTLVDKGGNAVAGSKVVELKNGYNGIPSSDFVSGNSVLVKKVGYTAYNPWDSEILPLFSEDDFKSEIGTFKSLDKGYTVFTGTMKSSGKQEYYGTKLFIGNREADLEDFGASWIKLKDYILDRVENLRINEGSEMRFAMVLAKLTEADKVVGSDGNLLNKLYDGGYKLYIEPVWQIQFREGTGEAKLVSGTARQLLKLINNSWNDGSDFSYWSKKRVSQFFNYACGLNNVSDDSCANFENFKKKFESYIDSNGFVNNSKLIKEILNDENYGVGIVSFFYPNDSSVTNEYFCNFQLNYCGDDNSDISFGLVATDSEGNAIDINRCVQNLSKAFDGQKCFSSIYYGVSDFISSFSDKKAAQGSYYNVPSLYATSTRTCYDSSSTSYYQFDDSSNFLKINLFGSTYDFTKENSLFSGETIYGQTYFNSDPSLPPIPLTLGISKSYIRSISNGVKYSLKKDGIKVFGDNGVLNVDKNTLRPISVGNTSAITFTSSDSYSKYVFVPSDALNNKEGYIQFSSDNALFGIENKKIIDKLKNGSISVNGSSGAFVGNSETYTYTLSVNNDSKMCKFNTFIDGDTPSSDSFFDNLQFRVISLSYPFPARDGGSRIPGINWLNDENYVYKYITNNRNIQDGSSDQIKNPDMMYLEKQPLYVINLDTSTMIKVRAYNSEHSYDDISLVCDGTSGRKCHSNFIRNTDIISNLEGTCSNINSDYYGCADKTEESGG